MEINHVSSEGSVRKTALITGASRGIGRAVAECFAEASYDLILTCISSVMQLEELAGALSRSYGINCRVVQADMGNADDVSRLFSKITELDVLINNAGISYFGLLSEMKTEDWRKLMRINLDAVFYTCRLAIPLMLKEHKGHIVNISSVWGNVGASMETAYSASKGGVNALTKALAKELAPSNIQVNAIACGMIDTDMNAHLSGEEMNRIRSEIPANRLGTPEEAARLVLQTVQAPPYMTGQIITIDGGWN